MSKRFSPALIGAFVVASLALVLIAIVVVGSGQLFRKPLRFVCMFEGNLNGLKVGAPVKFRGVQLGTVAEIRLRLKPSEGKLRPGAPLYRLPVIIELDQAELAARGGSGTATTGPGFEELIAHGLRAQLNVESILTGVLYIDLSLHPKSKLNLVLVPGVGYPEIPTIPTTIEQFQVRLTAVLEKLEEIDFRGLVVSLTDAAGSIRELASSPQLHSTLISMKLAAANLNTTVDAVHRAVDNANNKLEPVLSSLPPLVASLRQTSIDAQAAAKQASATMASMQSTLDPDSPTAVHLNEALEQLTDTSRSLGQLSDYLQRNPAALIRGRSGTN